MNPAPGFKQHPQHRVEARPSSVHVRVTYRGEVVADTRDAVELREVSTTGSVVAPVVYYIPRKDVRMDRLVRSSHRTHCPFTGDASPYDEMQAIKERLAFYPDKFEIQPS
jgi:uncharacterized protein (DUF427 family)